MTALQTNNAQNTTQIILPYGSLTYYQAGVLPGANLATASATFSTGTLYFVPMIVPYPNYFRSIACSTITAVAGASAVLGVYNASPNAMVPLAGSSPISGTTGTVSIATSAHANVLSFTPTFFAAGLYFLAYSPSANAAAQLANSVTGAGAVLELGCTAINTSTGSNTFVYGYTQSFTYSTTLPAVGTLSNVTATTLPFLAMISA